MSIRSMILAGGLPAMIALACLAVPGAASANSYRAHYISATAVCSGPLPVYDNNLKRRPLGILNQGSSSVFISCSVPSDFEGDQTNGSNIVEVHFNSFGAAGTVNCTLNAGNRSTSGSVATTTNVTAGGTNYLSWAGIDKVNAWGSYNFSCTLPPDIEMNLIIYQDGDASSLL
ncbi:MAG TPA: hypothetical protein VLM17_02590 [Xanthomonadaceae bacterium]|nr:hypothetical protein [Xanthomonadaceae bacterium]